ncbi:MAG: caspase family protein, partial [Myxococcota bacterium]
MFVQLLSLLLWALGPTALASPDCKALDPSPAKLVGTPGDRKIALLVGIGDYEAEPGGESIDLKGPPNDARRIRDLLIERYGFPVDNICTLLDDEATRAAFIDGWRKHVGRATQGDTVVYYFAGHGSQTTDFDGPQDEPDGMDETFLLHDSRATVPDLLDDEFNALLAEAYQRTNNITVLIDACNSGSATRSFGFATRKVDPVKRTRPIQNRIISPTGDYRPERFPGIVSITAAEDGSSALERGGQGVFTNALLRSLDARGDGSWSQIEPIVPRWIAAQRSFQTATFEGNLQREIFGKAVVDRSLSWSVHRVDGDTVKFRGPAMPGWTEQAIVEVFQDGTAKRKARVRLVNTGNFQAEGEIIGRAKRGVAPGDYALLETPGRDTVAIRVKIADGVAFAPALKRAINGDDVLARTIELVTGTPDFLVRAGEGPMIEIVGSEGVVRNRQPMRNAQEALEVAQNLGLHARQASLLALSAEPNDVYPHDVMGVRIIRDDFAANSCARQPYRPAASPVPYAEVPMCTPIQLEVTLERDPIKDLYLGIVYLANDGSISAWPEAGVTEILRRKGDTYTETLGTVAPPLDAPDRILVFGSHEPVRWQALEAKALRKERSIGDATLQSFVQSHIGGTRGIDDEAPESADPAWTSSFVQLRVTGSGWSPAEQT